MKCSINFKSVLLSGLLVTFLAFSVFAQTSESNQISAQKRDLIIQLMKLMKADKQAQEITATMIQQLNKDLPGLLEKMTPRNEELNAEARQKLNAVMQNFLTRISQQFQEKLSQRISYTELMEKIFLPIYDRYFTEEQIKSLITFYESSAGKRMVEVTPQLFQDAMTISGQILTPVVTEIFSDLMKTEVPKFTDEAMKIVSEATPSSSEPPPPPPPPKERPKPRTTKKKK